MKLILVPILVGVTLVCSAQDKPGWDKWTWLIGSWVGEGEGQPGQGSGTFSFSFDLDKNILVRKSHSEYPASDNKPKIIHDDLMVVYMDTKGSPAKAVYFDNEGHTIFYSAAFSENSIVLTSDKTENGPIFRLVYKLIDAETVNVKFEMSQDGINFMTYVEGNSKKSRAKFK